MYEKELFNSIKKKFKKNVKIKKELDMNKNKTYDVELI